MCFQCLGFENSCGFKGYLVNASNPLVGARVTLCLSDTHGHELVENFMLLRKFVYCNRIPLCCCSVHCD